MKAPLSGGWWVMPSDEVGGGVIVVPADDVDGVVGGLGAVVVVGVGRSVVVGGVGRVAHAAVGVDAGVHGPVGLDRPLDGVVVGRPCAVGQKQDVLHVLDRRESRHELAVAVGVGRLVDRTVPARELGGRHVEVPAVVDAVVEVVAGGHREVVLAEVLGVVGQEVRLERCEAGERPAVVETALVADRRELAGGAQIVGGTGSASGPSARAALAQGRASTGAGTRALTATLDPAAAARC